MTTETKTDLDPDRDPECPNCFGSGIEVVFNDPCFCTHPADATCPSRGDYIVKDKPKTHAAGALEEFGGVAAPKGTVKYVKAETIGDVTDKLKAIAGATPTATAAKGTSYTAAIVDEPAKLIDIPEIREPDWSDPETDMDGTKLPGTVKIDMDGEPLGGQYVLGDGTMAQYGQKVRSTKDGIIGTVIGPSVISGKSEAAHHYKIRIMTSIGRKSRVNHTLVPL
jgi:hypothetical protein